MGFPTGVNTGSRTLKRSGFTLVELMIALLIMGVLLTAIYRVFISQESMFRAQEQAAEMQENVRATSEFLHQEMSWLGYDIANLAIRYAGTTQIIYKANLPNTGGTDSFIRYTFDATNEMIMRAVETTLTAVQNDNNLKVLANDVDSLTFSYFDGFGAAISAIAVGNPAVSPAQDNTLASIRRVRSTIVVKSSRPDWNYTHPDPKYNNDHFRRRSAVVDVKTRNVEDITLVFGGGGTGTCSSFLMDITYPGASGNYSSCSDQQDELATGTQTLTDNPLVTITVVDPDGNPDDSTPVSISANYDYIFKDAGGSERSVISGRTNGIGSLYLAASSIAAPAEGTQVTVNTYFTPPEAGCLQLSHTETLTITSGTPSRFDTLAPYNPDIQSLEYVLLDTGNNASPQPATLPICSSASNIGAKLKVRVEDDCNNGIEGETVVHSILPSGKGSFQAATADNGDGTFSVVYVPPDTITTGASSETVDITAQWTTSSDTRTLTLTPGSAYDMVVNSIVGPVDGGGSPLYQFTNPAANSFNMERVSNQLVQVNFSVEDACGNRVFGQEGNLTITPSYGTATAVAALADGTYTFDWYSPFGCGPAISNQNIVITNSGITGALGTETIDFNLLASLEPRLVLSVTKSTAPYGLTAGCTSDEVDVSAVLQEFDPVVDECINIVRPEGSVTDSYPVTFTVTGSSATLGNGSFNHADLAQDTATTSTDALGYAYATLNPGSGMKNQILTVTADADVDGQIYPVTASVQVPMLVSTPNTGSGFYDSGYSAKKGVTEAVRHYDPNDSIYVQVGDCDENEYVFQVDAIGSPIVSVTLQSELTGDIEKFEIIETGANSATFRFASGVMTQLNTVATPGDSMLQVDYGDRVTMKYTDNDDTAPATEYTWDVFISGPRWLNLYRDNGDGTESLILSGGAQVLTMYNNNRMRPKVYIPMFESDSSISTDTVTALDSSGSGGESETVTFREVLDTGVFIPDINAYGTDNILLSTTGSIPLANELYLGPFTPKTITVSYPDTSPIKTASFVVEDEDLPEVIITAPTDGSSVIGAVTVDVYAADINNTINPAITQVDLYIDTYLVKTWSAADLTGTNTYSWVTEAGGVPYWLNGTHTMYARAMDGAGNWNTSASVSVTVTNPGSAIWFTAPANNSIWNSTTVSVGMQTVLDTINTSYSVTLEIGTTFRTVNDLGGNAYSYTWDTSIEGHGPKAMVAQVQDSQGNTASATWSAIVDHTAPNVIISDSPNLWHGDTAPYSWAFTVSDDYGFADSTNTVLVSVNGTGGFTDQPAQWGGSTWDGSSWNALYSFSWAGPGSAVEDTSYSWSVKAYDSSLPAPGNLGTGSLAFYVDNIHPTVGTPTVSASWGSLDPTYGPFVKGTVTMNSQVNDSFASSGLIYFISKDDPLGTVTATFDVTSDPAMALSWETAGDIIAGIPWPDGAYAIYVKGRDLAFNENITAMTQSYHFYVDNGIPSIAGSNTPAMPAFVTSVVSVPYYADANIGFLASTGYSIFDSSGVAMFSSGTSFSLVSAVASTKTNFIIDSRGAPVNGPYSMSAGVSDHAENSFNTARVPFEICNRVATLGTVTWTVAGADFILDLAGTLSQRTPSGAVAATGLIDITVTNLKNSQSYADSVTASALGKFVYVHTVTEIAMNSTDSIQVDVENTDSGCHTNFTIDEDSNTQALPP